MRLGKRLPKADKLCRGLRSSAVDTQELGDAIRAVGEELASDPAHKSSMELRLNIEGMPRALRPLVRDEVYRIASEGLRNAFRHARANRIEVQLDYGKQRFELRVRDDGKGIDLELLDNIPEGHFGLRGMRERAKEIGGKFAIWTAPESGTELELRVPGEAAYLDGEVKRRAWFEGPPQHRSSVSYEQRARFDPDLDG